MKADTINLKKASQSLKTQFKPIHELECEGVITQDPAKWIKETYKLGTERFSNNQNNNEKQYNRILDTEAKIRSDKIDGIYHPEIHVYDHLQAKAAMENNKGADKSNTVPEILKSRSYNTCTDIHNNFNCIYNNDNTSKTPHNNQRQHEQPQLWQNTEYNGIEKKANNTKAKDQRYIAKIDHHRQWYNKAWLPQYVAKPLRPPHHNTTPRNYGFKKGHAPHDIT